MHLMSQIESLLFVSGEAGLTLDELATLLETKRADLAYNLAKLRRNYALDPQRGLQLVVVNHRYQLVTKVENASIIQGYAQSPFAQKLSQAALETLTIIAYKQPVTRLAIDEIRGVNSQAMIQKLELRDLVIVVGRQDSPGRPKLYGVSDYFYQYFGIDSLDELPSLDSLFTDESAEINDLFSSEEEQ
ncbi:SMC-Scp complex subunit ScpB [Aerococcus kribbianus]|uniref:Segregation and condensation protein B n=1 Tax=Aerococcus kribbianus TaxID=2999064 RepID=A0A9X3FQF6_9LACT|nr:MULTISPECIES: SMC-Scp complex subunit ScpB [unclassified Aerococcus]MCZ0717661.1 SMC-Scp complex subunit ScpB [Aerococcus sp. YH-aer221]MCZ0725949.1 SMC-Scp complex subunit ScpB [Aerococcus sp. YH-aer222]